MSLRPRISLLATEAPALPRRAMEDPVYRSAFLGPCQLGPWTVTVDPDPDFDDVDRQVHHSLLTDPDLLTCFRRQFPGCGDTDYDTMVRCLGYVWDCPADRTANVAGHCCGSCGQTKAHATRSEACP